MTDNQSESFCEKELLNKLIIHTSMPYQLPSYKQQIQSPQSLQFNEVNKVANGFGKPNKIEIEKVKELETEMLMKDDQQVEKKDDPIIERVTRQKQEKKNQPKRKRNISLAMKKRQILHNLLRKRQSHYCKCQIESCNKGKCSCLAKEIKCKNGCKCIPKNSTCNNPYNNNNSQNAENKSRTIMKIEGEIHNQIPNTSPKSSPELQINASNPHSQSGQQQIQTSPTISTIY